MKPICNATNGLTLTASEFLHPLRVASDKPTWDHREVVFWGGLQQMLASRWGDEMTFLFRKLS